MLDNTVVMVEHRLFNSPIINPHHHIFYDILCTCIHNILVLLKGAIHSIPGVFATNEVLTNHHVWTNNANVRCMHCQ